MRIKFEKLKQRKFLDLVMQNSNCPSLAELSRRLSVNYQSLKNYFSERRILSEEIFSDLCLIGNLQKENFQFKEINEHWGQMKGGKIGRK